MNNSDRKKMIQSRSIRCFYGGKWEPLIHILMIAILYGALLYPVENPRSDNSLFAPIIVVGVSTLFWLPIVNYWQVGKIHPIGRGSQTEINYLLECIKSDGYEIKARGKYSIEAYYPKTSFLPPNTHVVVFSENGELFAAAWRYASRGFEYVPFYFGRDRIEYLKKLLDANNKGTFEP